MPRGLALGCCQHIKGCWLHKWAAYENEFGSSRRKTLKTATAEWYILVIVIRNCINEIGIEGGQSNGGAD